MPTYPLALLDDGRAPEISSGFGPRKMPGGKMVDHLGADITYRALPSDPPPRVKNGRVVYTANRTRRYFSPPGRVVTSTEDGVVVQARVKPGIGGDVWVHHPASGNVTRYAHLSSIAVKEGQRVREGQRLGVWGAGHGTPFVHLHFELLTAGKKNSQRDPASYLAGAADNRGSGGSSGPSADSQASPGAASRAGKLATAGGGGWPWLLLLLLIGVRASTRS